ncbi:hypothetical protein VPH49_21745 [Pseudomonas luteola]|uniref:hypothetical protein n=1 Tax=Pseudomonas luteola TaxID=47886 RepID=UPI003A8AAE8E
MTAAQTIDTTNAVEIAAAAIDKAAELSPIGKLQAHVTTISRSQNKLATLAQQVKDNAAAYEKAKVDLMAAVENNGDVMDASRAMQSAKAKATKLQEQFDELVKAQQQAFKEMSALTNDARNELNQLVEAK